VAQVSTIPIDIPETTPDERTMATLAHALQIVSGFIAPMIILIVKRDSKFVAFHAVQALLLQLVNMLFSFVLFGLWMGIILGAAFTSGPKQTGPPPSFLFVFPLVFLGVIGDWLFTLVMAILYGIKAGRGEWAGYPVIGGWARRILKI
jgi:uncharacterized protein